MSDHLRVENTGTRDVPTHVSPVTPEVVRAYEDMVESWNVFGDSMKRGEVDYVALALLGERMRALGREIEKGRIDEAV